MPPKKPPGKEKIKKKPDDKCHHNNRGYCKAKQDCDKKHSDNIYAKIQSVLKTIVLKDILMNVPMASGAKKTRQRTVCTCMILLHQMTRKQKLSRNNLT